MNITFTTNLYDWEGDKFKDGIVLHFEKTGFMLVVENLDELNSMINNLQRISKEVSETYPGEF